jgi:hypothetical protein
MKQNDALILPSNLYSARDTYTEKDYFSVNQHILAEFGLNLLYSRVKKGFFSTKDIEQLQMLDPYIQILTEGLLSKYDKIAALSLKV